MKASYPNILSGALRALVAAGALTAVSLFFYHMAFHQFQLYDDEGYVMLTQQGFNKGYALYDDIWGIHLTQVTPTSCGWAHGASASQSATIDRYGVGSTATACCTRR